ncbi:MAG: DMT family transporter [Desulfobacterales bacterium]|nr:DMT family transporter [Desulfobacterales bacterium]
MSIGFAMAACLGWGIADFIGGYKSRDLSTLTVLLISNGVGVSLLSAVLVVSGRPFFNDPGLVWAVPAGVTGIVSMYLLYRSLAIGTMAVLAPVSATGVILPVIWGMVNGDTLSGPALGGMVMALAGTMMAAMEKSKDKVRWTNGIGHALGAAVCIGFYFILMDRACETDPLWASMIMRTTTFILLVPVVLVYKTRGAGRPLFTTLKGHLYIILFMGCMDTLAAFSFALATRSGMLSIVAVISSLYPAVTVLLSTVIIREKLRRIQYAGVIFAVSGVGLISGF